MEHYRTIQAVNRPERLTESRLLSECNSSMCQAIINTINALQTLMIQFTYSWNIYQANPSSKQDLALAWQDYSKLQFNLGFLAGFDPLYPYLGHYGLLETRAWADEINSYWYSVKAFADLARENLVAATLNS